MTDIQHRAGRSIVRTAFFGALLSILPLHMSTAQTALPAAVATPPAVTAHDARAVARSEERIKDLHDRLNITTAQEPLWNKVAQVMRDNGAAFRKNLPDHSAPTKTMSAVDDLKSFQIIADQHADGLKKLIPAFAALYDALSPEQQKKADHMFRKHRRYANL